MPEKNIKLDGTLKDWVWIAEVLKSVEIEIENRRLNGLQFILALANIVDIESEKEKEMTRRLIKIKALINKLIDECNKESNVEKLLRKLLNVFGIEERELRWIIPKKLIGYKIPLNYLTLGRFGINYRDIEIFKEYFATSDPQLFITNNTEGLLRVYEERLGLRRINISYMNTNTTVYRAKQLFGHNVAIYWFEDHSYVIVFNKNLALELPKRLKI